MLVQESFVTIAATPAVVERYLTDPALMGQWRSPLVFLESVEGTLLAAGSKHNMRLKSFALAGPTCEVKERDSSHILIEMSGMFTGKELWRWMADGSRTVVMNRVEYDVTDPSLRVFVAGFGNLLAQLDMNVQMSRLQQVVEEAKG